VNQAILEDILVFVAGIVGMGCVTGIIITMLKRRGKPLASSESSELLRGMADRLQRLEGSVDTIAVEIERVSEAQRFTTKVLTERASPQVLPDRARGINTPH
jgi:hypothetical protein